MTLKHGALDDHCLGEIIAIVVELAKRQQPGETAAETATISQIELLRSARLRLMKVLNHTMMAA